jgi:hypothetical protein
VPIGLRRYASAVGAAGDVTAAAPSSPTGNSTAPAGFAPIFAGWNVWDVWQATDPTFQVMMAGLTLDRRLKIWVENETKAAPGVAIADPANPAALVGDQIQIIPKVEGLELARSRGAVLEHAGAHQIGSSGSGVALRTVRFFNRGTPGALPWPNDENDLLENVWEPSESNAVTNAPQPSSLGGLATELSEGAKTALKVVAIGAGVVLGGVLIYALVNSSRKVAA